MSDAGQASGSPNAPSAPTPQAPPGQTPPGGSAPHGQTAPSSGQPQTPGPGGQAPGYGDPGQGGGGGGGGGKDPGANKCPEPGPPYIDYQVDAAAAKKESDLYTADAAAVAKNFAAFDGAQDAYAKAKDASRDAFIELKATLARIKENLDRVVPEAKRTQLKTCWDKLSKETEPPQPADCATVDGWKCAELPKEIATLRQWATSASACAAKIDTEFDRLANLPKTLGGRVTALAGRAKKLEGDVCTSHADAEKHYVEYLQLAHESTELDQDWVEPTAFVCLLRNAFATLLKRHTLSICIQVAILRWERHQELEVAAKGERAKNLVDLVLECSRQPQSTTSP